MRALGCLAKGTLVLLALPTGLLLLVGIPWGAYVLLGLLLGHGRAGDFVPPIGLYVLALGLAGLAQGTRWGTREHSSPFRLPGVVWLGTGAVLAVAGGQVLLASGGGPLFSVAFLLAAALPPLAALAVAVRRLGPATTWRRAMAGFVSGSLLSVFLTLLLSGLVSFLAYLLVMPLRALVAQALSFKNAEQLFYSPALVLALIEMALVAPVVEEFTKPVGAFLLARRLRGPAEAFLVGMAGGAGFAVLENMLYESAGAGVWAGIAALRGLGGVLHPLNAGLVAVGWYAVRKGQPGAWRRLLGLYGVAVGLHALWNGGQVVLYSRIGAHFFGTDTWRLDVYGLGQPGVMLVFLLLEAAVMWRLLPSVAGRLGGAAAEGPEPAPSLRLERPRRLALWAMAAVALVVPVAALYGPTVESYLRIAMPTR